MKKIIVSIVAVLLMAMANVVAVVPSEASAASGTCTSHFLGIRAWYDGLATSTSDGGCEIKGPDAGDEGLRKYVWTIALNVTSMILVDICIQVNQRLVSHSPAPQIGHTHRFTLNAIVRTFIIIGREICVENIRRPHTYHGGVKDFLVELTVDR